MSLIIETGAFSSSVNVSISIPTVQIDTEEEENNDWYCDDCERSFQDGESCNC